MILFCFVYIKSPERLGSRFQKLKRKLGCMQQKTSDEKRVPSTNN